VKRSVTHHFHHQRQTLLYHLPAPCGLFYLRRNTMPVVQQGSINTTALIVPDVYVQKIVPPQVTLLNGVPTNLLGVVGTASWGPVNAPTVFGDMAGYARQFGPLLNRKHDMGTAVAAAVLQGANNMVGVRVSDTTDLYATAAVQDNCLAISSLYTGSLANADTVTVGAGSQAGTLRITIARAGLVPEVFDNITGTGNARWVNAAIAINQGQSGLRGASQLVRASAGSGTADIVPQGYTLAGGTDGAGDTAINGSVLLGQDTAPRKGMYALRNTGASVAMLVDCDEVSSFPAQIAFGLAEGMYMIGTTPPGDSIANAITAKTGIDSYAFKYLLGDWVYFNDSVNGVVRAISPQGFVAGLLVNLSPEQSSLNKPLKGIVGTQKSAANEVYSSAELQQLIQAGIDVIANPSPGGNYFSCRAGHNSSSNPLINGDNYSRLTNYIAFTLNQGMGQFVGQLQTDTERRIAQSTLEYFLANMEDQNMIGDPDGGAAFAVQLDAANNPAARVALGYQQADVQVKYLSVVEKFIVNVEGGTSVSISKAA
jgi:hypothetical protein